MGCFLDTKKAKLSLCVKNRRFCFSVALGRGMIRHGLGMAGSIGVGMACAWHGKDVHGHCKDMDTSMAGLCMALAWLGHGMVLCLWFLGCMV